MTTGPGRPIADGPDEAARWRAGRREAAEAHAEALARSQRAASTRARAMLAELVARALVEGPPPEPLRARSSDGRTRYRTPLQGWYLRQDETLAVDTDGEYYVLTAPASLAARFTGVQPTPQDPPLILGAGGRDGESLDLDVAIARVLARGTGSR